VTVSNFHFISPPNEMGNAEKWAALVRGGAYLFGRGSGASLN